jgi:hypothetical protein
MWDLMIRTVVVDRDGDGGSGDSGGGDRDRGGDGDDGDSDNENSEMVTTIDMVRMVETVKEIVDNRNRR